MFVMCLFVCRWVLWVGGDYHMFLLCGTYAHL